MGAEGLGGRRAERRQGARAHDQPQPADHRRRPRRAPRLRRAAAEDGRRPRRTGCSKATAWCAIDPDAHLDTIARAFKWTPRRCEGGAAKVHLSNLPENLAFFSGAIDAAGSFGGIYQSAVLRLRPRADQGSGRRRALRSISSTSRRSRRPASFKDQKIAIAPIRTGRRRRVETDPLLSKDIRFLFEPNSAVLDQSNPENIEEPRSHQEAAAGQPGIDRAAARPRRQRARRRVPQAGRRGVRPDRWR